VGFAETDLVGADFADVELRGEDFLAGADLAGMGVFDLGGLGLVAGRAKCCRVLVGWVAWARALVDLVLARLG